MTKIPLLFFVLAPILLGIIHYILDFKKINILLILFQLFLVGILSSYWDTILTVGSVELLLTPYSQHIGMTIKMDQLSFIMLLLNNLLFMLMFIISFGKNYHNKLFVFLFLILQGVINGIFLSTDLFNVYLLIEVATILVSILVMFKKDGRSLYDGMLYLIINMVGMAFFLMGIAYVYKIVGVLDFNGIERLIKNVPKNSLVLPFAFLMTGASLKSAFMPLFSWLPKAHGTASAPTVVSAILSGIFVKTGIYLFIRLSIIFSPMLDMSQVFKWVALLTIILGSLFAISQHDIKLILAYSTISQVGLMMLGLNYFNGTAYYGGLFYLVNHGIFKSLLFIISGILIQIYNTRDIRLMKGLWYKSKFLSLILIIAILSITGMPLLGSGLSKYLISIYYEGFINKALFSFITFGTMLYMSKFITVIFSKASKTNHYRPQTNTAFVLLAMSVLLIMFGVLGKTIIYETFNYSVKMDRVTSFYKVFEFISLFVVTFFIHNQVKLVKMKESIRKVDFSFNTINFSILMYFLILVVVGNLTIQ